MIYHVLANNPASPYNSIASLPVNTVGANLIVIQFVTYPNFAFSGGTISDTYGNTYTLVGGTSYGAAGGPYVSLAYARPAATGPSDVISISAVTTLTSGSVTPSVNGELLITAVNTNLPGTPTTYSIGNAFTVVDSVQQISGVSYGMAAACSIQTTAAAINPTWSSTTSGPMTASIYAFKP
jgi:hypothetical protein